MISLFSRAHGETFFTVLPFFVPEQRTRYRKAQDLPAASTTVIEVYRRPGGLMSSETPERGKAAFRPAFTARPSVIPPKYPEISSLLTTVRLLSDRSRPPQVGATAHTCTASADRTTPAASQPLPFPLSRESSATRPAPALPPRRTATPSAESGGPGGGIISPGGGRGRAPLLRLVHLPILLRCSGLSVFLFCLS